MSKWDRLRGPPRTLLGYAVAVIAVGTATVATLALGPAMKHTPTLFFCAVMLGSWFGGVGPGILAGLLSALALDYYFIPPLHALGISLEEAPDMVVFVASAAFVGWLSGEQQRAEDSLRQARDELDARVFYTTKPEGLGMGLTISRSLRITDATADYLLVFVVNEPLPTFCERTSSNSS